MSSSLIVLALAAAVTAAAAALRARRRRRAAPREAPARPWSWEGIHLELEAPGAPPGDAAGAPPGGDEPPSPAGRRARRPRLVIRGEYMARPSIYRAAASDWAFSRQPTPILVLFDVGRGVELHRASLDRIHAERQALVEGLSISHALPPPLPPVPDDGDRREGAPFAVDIGFYLEPRDAPWELRVHAELGPLRSEPLSITVPPAPPAPATDRRR